MDYKLFHKDCIEGMKQLPSKSLDITVTSPPYNLGIKYSKYSDKCERTEYLEWTLDWTNQVYRVLKDDGSLFLNLGSSPNNPLLPHQVALLLSEEWTLQNTFHWIKSISLEKKDGEHISAGHFKPINSKRYVTDCHEYVFHFTKTGNVTLDRLAVGVPYADKSNISRWGHTKGKDRRCRGNNWFIPYNTIQNRNKERPHPATFPYQLAETCIMLHSGGRPCSILDPFLGIGNTLTAAQNCGMASFVGYEIDEHYLDEAINLTTENATIQ
ncbi:DNA-methyltransferase [Cerasicoccus fimbriatus]|uniref:DNA-methyltransferase n=1 Tax=Cerasicoccus fimbriatus TaxID=3014554 RepID=UPI0022B5BD27|nr:site-specific DNA-methyltransferase [Cerasicoccus sp. TK19100]